MTKHCATCTCDQPPRVNGTTPAGSVETSHLQHWPGALSRLTELARPVVTCTHGKPLTQQCGACNSDPA